MRGQEGLATPNVSVHKEAMSREAAAKVEVYRTSSESVANGIAVNG
jgi:hypothetical protein